MVYFNGQIAAISDQFLFLIARKRLTSVCFSLLTEYALFST